MEDRRLKEEYKEIFDKIHAPEYLKNKILEKKIKKRNYSHIIALAGTVAAALTIFAAVGDYNFTNKDNEGVIDQTTVIEKAVKTEEPINTKKTLPKETETNQPEPQRTEAIATAVVPTRQPEQQKKTERPTIFPTKTPLVTKKPIQTKERIESVADVRTVTATEPMVTITPVEPTQPIETEKIIQAEVPVAVQTSQPIVSEVNEIEKIQNNEAIEASKDKDAQTGLEPASVEMEENQAGNRRMVFDAEADTIQMEEWENNRYFDYIGNDIVSRIEANSDFIYIGADTNFVAVDSGGQITSDEWNFAFESPDGGFVNIITSKKNTETVLPPNAQTININSVNAVISETEGSFTCYIQHNGVMYTIFTTSVTKEAFISLITTLIS